MLRMVFQCKYDCMSVLYNKDTNILIKVIINTSIVFLCVFF